ncbi:MAG: SGNH/GDSL hydrolase family protein [Isosphaeraceae bacterium]
MRRHLILLGDSIFDNAGYVPGGRPAVIDQVRSRLPAGWAATLLAIDGNVINYVHRQLKSLPADATHLVLSIGGNDVLAQIPILRERVATVGDALRLLLASRTQFQEDYQSLMEAIRDLGLPTAVCTIYNPCSDDDAFQRAAVAALCLYNDAIIDRARHFKLPVIDLRVVCSKISDYANEIEPSAAGGAKIAEAICRLITTHDFVRLETVLLP